MPWILLYIKYIRSLCIYAYIINISAAVLLEYGLRFWHNLEFAFFSWINTTNHSHLGFPLCYFYRVKVSRLLFYLSSIGKVNIQNFECNSSKSNKRKCDDNLSSNRLTQRKWTNDYWAIKRLLQNSCRYSCLNRDSKFTNMQYIVKGLLIIGAKRATKKYKDSSKFHWLVLPKKCSKHCIYSTKTWKIKLQFLAIWFNSLDKEMSTSWICLVA